MTGDPHSEPLTSLQERAMEQVREYLRCVPCPNFCSRDGVLHANACCMSVADEPGFVDSLRSLVRDVVGPVEKELAEANRKMVEMAFELAHFKTAELRKRELEVEKTGRIEWP